MKLVSGGRVSASTLYAPFAPLSSVCSVCSVRSMCAIPVLGSLGLLDFLALLAASEIRIREVSFAMCSAPESQPSALASNQQWS